MFHIILTFFFIYQDLEIYRSAAIVYRGLGVMSKEEFLSADEVPALRISLHQWFARIIMFLGCLKNISLDVYMIGKRDIWFIFLYTQLLVGMVSICFESVRNRRKMIAIARQLEANAKPKEKKFMAFLVSGWCVIAVLTQIIRSLILCLVWMQGSEFEDYINRFWFGSAATNPFWLSIILVVSDLVAKYLSTTICFLSVPLFVLSLYHVVLQFESLRDDIVDRLLENETTMTTTAEMVEFRGRFANIVRVIQLLNEVGSTLLTVLSAQLGIFFFTFILLVLRGQTTKNTQTEALESIAYVVIIMFLGFIAGHIIFRLDSRRLFPITEVRMLSVFHALDDEDFFNQSEGLVDQMLHCPRITFSHFFDLDRQAIISVVGTIGTYFMSMMSIDKTVHAQVMSLIQPAD